MKGTLFSTSHPQLSIISRLSEETDPDGLQTTYTYDPLGRVLSKREGAYVTNYTYDAYHLIEEQDPMGISTCYSYNLAGQKTKEERAGRATEFSYDPLGFLQSRKTSDRRICLQNDVLGRAIEKNVDGVLTTTFTYDTSGNVASISKGDPVYFSYDSYDRLIEKIDEEGGKTKIIYEEGDQFLIKRITDPRGVETIEKYNAHGLLLKREIPGSLIEEFDYDRALRLVSQDHLTFAYTPEGFLSSMSEAGLRTTYWTYTPAGKIQSKIKPDGTTIPYEYNSQGELIRMGPRQFAYDGLGRLVKGSGFSRELDTFGNILREEFATGLSIESSYDHSNRPIRIVLPDGSQILYEYEGPFLKTVNRVGNNGSLLYMHRYDQFDAKGNPLNERGLFATSYGYDKAGRRVFQKSPYFEETLMYDPVGNLIQKGDQSYTYDTASQLINEEGKFSVAYDQHYNCISKNGEEIFLNDLNQRRDLEYDLNGNLLRPGFVYDEFDQLVQTGTDTFSYDALGRRLSSGSVSYFYIDDEEIGSFEEGQIKELKIMGSKAPIAIEINEKSYAPVVDVQNTIRKLVDWDSKEVAFENACDVFGNNLNGDIPYAYVGKRYDVSTNLVYFGKRFYDPSIVRWLTPDPLGAIDHSNLYQYVFNNPYRFQDPNGENVLGFLCGIGQIIAGGAIMASGVALEFATFGGYTFAFGFHEAAGLGLMASGCAMATYHAQDIKTPNMSWKNTNPFDGPVDGEIFIGDTEGNIITVPEGNWLTGSKDGKWIQEMEPGNKPEGKPTGKRKDGGHNPGPKHPDPKAWEPHGHVPGVTNPDGTPWLPIH